MSQFKILMRIIILKILIFFTLISCKSGFSTKEFKLSEIPESPNYELLSSWAAHPYIDDSLIDKYYSIEKSELKADIFYIYPTLLTSKENDSWNSDIFDTLQNSASRIQSQCAVSVRTILPYFHRTAPGTTTAVTKH